VDFTEMKMKMSAKNLWIFLDLFLQKTSCSSKANSEIKGLKLKHCLVRTSHTKTLPPLWIFQILSFKREEGGTAGEERKSKVQAIPIPTSTILHALGCDG
jgi:hypothetical protein